MYWNVEEEASQSDKKVWAWWQDKKKDGEKDFRAGGEIGNVWEGHAEKQ